MVEEIDPSALGFMKESAEGEPGYLVIKSSSAMLGYHGPSKDKHTIWYGDWYTGLGDIAFTLQNSEDGQNDFYWVSRVSGLLIRGGANYSCEQIAADIGGVVYQSYGLSSFR